jgi:uncharacterized integral membrane protein
VGERADLRAATVERMTEEYRSERDKSRRISAKAVVWIVVAVVVLIFILQNTNDVRVDLLFWNVTTGLWLMLLLVFLIGLGLGWLLTRLRAGRHDDGD